MNTLFISSSLITLGVSFLSPPSTGISPVDINFQEALTLKSFELSSKQNIGYESPEVLNESAFRYDKPDDTGFQETKKSEKQLKRPCIVNRPNKNNETYVSKKKNTVPLILFQIITQKNKRLLQLSRKIPTKQQHFV